MSETTMVERLAAKWEASWEEPVGPEHTSREDARWWLRAIAEEAEVVALEDDATDEDGVYAVTARLRTEADR